MAKKKSFWQENQANIVGWVVITLFILGLAVFATISNQQRSDLLSEILTVREDDNIKGAVDPKVVVYKYSDFGCTFCAQNAPVLSEVGLNYSDNVAIVYRYFPLSESGTNFDAALAAVAAGNQGEFWQMHDLIFNDFQIWTQTDNGFLFFNSYAQALGLDMEQFYADVDSAESRDRILRDRNEGRQLGITGTPTFYINQELFKPTSISPAEFDEPIQRLLSN